MDIEAKAKRAAKKRNNKVAKEMPLLVITGTIPSEYLTTPEEQITRLQNWEKFNEMYFEKLKALDQDFLNRAAIYRERVKAVCTSDVFCEIDKQAKARWRQEPSYQADFWHCKLHELTGSW